VDNEWHSVGDAVGLPNLKKYHELSAAASQRRENFIEARRMCGLQLCPEEMESQAQDTVMEQHTVAKRLMLVVWL
jgi:hypothetical protein